MNTHSDFSLLDMIRAHVGGTWGKVRSHEQDVVAGLTSKHGGGRGNYTRIPGHALRDLNVAQASAGGYLVATEHLDYLPALQPASVALTLGATMVPAGQGGAAMPRGTTGATASWLVNEAAQTGESTPVFGQVSGTPKLLSAYCEVSRLLLLQSNAEDVIRAELRRAAGAALDAAILAGSSVSGQPTGIVNAPGIGAFTGASVAQTHLRDAQEDVGTANGIVTGRVGYTCAPAIAEILATRQRFTGSDRCLWEGPSHDGTVEGARALATTGCPAATIIFGDWGAVFVLEWPGGLEILIDPYTKFTIGLVGVRLLFAVDVFVTRAGSFSVATSVT